MTNDDHEYWNGLAITVGAAAALCAVLLLCGCSTIRDAVDEYRDWRDSQTNAPAVPPDVPPDVPPERIAHIITNMPPRRTFRVPTPGLRPWCEDRHYSLGDFTTWQRGIYYCLQSHTAHTGAGWSPDRVPALWYLVRKAGEVIPAWRQPLGAHDAYQLGDVVMHKGAKWRSLIDHNIWEPGVYGWEVIP